MFVLGHPRRRDGATWQLLGPLRTESFNCCAGGVNLEAV